MSLMAIKIPESGKKFLIELCPIVHDSPVKEAARYSQFIHFKFHYLMSENTVKIEIPAKTYFKAFGLLLLAFSIVQLAAVLLLLFISLLIGTTLNSIEKFLLSKGWKKTVADIFIVATFVGLILVILFVVIPQALSQMKDVFVHVPQLEKELEHMAPKEVQVHAGKLFKGSSPDSMTRIWTQLSSVANQTVNSFFQTILLFIVAVYMFLDGKRSYLWIVAFFKPETRKRIDVTTKEIQPIVEAYIIGQATTSTIAALWVFGTAEILGVPGAVTLAVLAAVFDILPGVGFLLNVTTAGLLALTVSTDTAIFMTLSLMSYCAIENYILIPLIYGNRLKLSPLVVLVSIIISGALAGIPGMIAVLPIVAAYGPIERHWLKRRPGMAEAVELHQKEDS